VKIHYKFNGNQKGVIVMEEIKKLYEESLQELRKSEFERVKDYIRTHAALSENEIRIDLAEPVGIHSYYSNRYPYKVNKLVAGFITNELNGLGFKAGVLDCSLKVEFKELSKQGGFLEEVVAIYKASLQQLKVTQLEKALEIIRNAVKKAVYPIIIELDHYQSEISIDSKTLDFVKEGLIGLGFNIEVSGKGWDKKVIVTF
jgi:hypothetical protein